MYQVEDWAQQQSGDHSGESCKKHPRQHYKEPDLSSEATFDHNGKVTADGGAKITLHDPLLERFAFLARIHINKQT